MAGEGNSESFTGGKFNVNSPLIQTTFDPGGMATALSTAATSLLNTIGNGFRAIGEAVTASPEEYARQRAATEARLRGAGTSETAKAPVLAAHGNGDQTTPPPLGGDDGPGSGRQNAQLANATPVLGDVSGSSLNNNRQSNGDAIKEFDGPVDIWTRPEPPLLFPSNLTTTALKFPFIGFVARMGAAGERSIYLPIPPGISFSDQMQYSTIDLGIIGKAVARATTAAVNEGGFFSGAGGAIGAAVGTLVNQARSANGAAAASLVAKGTGFDNVANFIDFGSRQVISPNTNTAFQNSGVRQFQFSFKMMPKDQKEAFTITEIVKRFRQNMYPMGNDLILTYPPIWNIKFYDGAKSEENTKLPAIYDCYLTGMSAVYNSSGNMFHADGHPVETDVQLTFEETRALTLSDIVKLSENRF